MVKASLPARGCGAAVGGGVLVGGVVGLGVEVMLGVGVTLGVGVRVVVGVGAAVPAAVGVAWRVLTTIGVQVGVAPPVDATTVAPGLGITSTCPARIRAGFEIPFASASALTVTPKRIAISERVSPGRTM
jgi:hypothetical protein